MEGWHVAVCQPLLGTTLEVQVRADTDGEAARAQAAVVDRVQQLSSVFSVFDPASELRRWRRGELEKVSGELAEVLAGGEEWFRASRGAFHPGCRALLELWQRAVQQQVLPDPALLSAAVDRLAELPFRVRAGAVERVGDCSGVDVNALAKGYIVDRALDHAWTLPGVRGLVVNAGGDLRHRGTGQVSVRLEDPHRPYDNAEPLTRVQVSNAAVATSGSVHRGFSVGGRWFGHVVDPRTGWPVEHTVSACVLAPDAATADVLATVVLVLAPEEGLRFADERADSAVLLVDEHRRVRRSGRWPTEVPEHDRGART